jgi:catechol 2,3-dioxygenase-like lactoylglutathione lyase family enzyme
VTDLAASVAFYTEHFNFKQLGDFQQRGYGVLENHGVLLVLTKAPAPINIADDHCHARINFAVADLNAQREAMERGGVKFTAEGTSGVGRFATFLDPSGNRHNIKELNKNAAPENVADGPLVYDVGISVTDMSEAERFYVEALGFEVMTRKYYPPVIPITQRGSAFFILSDDAEKPAAYAYDRTAFTGLAFETGDLAAAMKRLREKGVKFIDDQPRETGTVRHAAFLDPFGNVHEVVEHTREAAQAAPSNAHALDGLDWLAGTWVSDDRDHNRYLEEVWASPVNSAMIGVFRWHRDGKPWMCELMSIAMEGDKPVFRLRHFDPALKPWEKESPLIYPLAKASENEVVFEDPNHAAGHPLRIIYRVAGDQLTVRLEEGDGKGQDFVFTRVDESSKPAKPQAAGGGGPLGFTGGVLVRFNVTDRAKSRDWYRDMLGFKVLFEVEEIGWTEMSNDEAKMTIGFSQAPVADIAAGMAPVLGVRDIEATRKHLEGKGVKFTGETITHDGLVKLATLLDPDGHQITLYQALGD